MVGLGLSLGLSALSAIPGIAQGLVANRQHRKYADLIGSQNRSMPTGITEAEGLLRRSANTGLYGKDIYESSVKNMMPLYLAQASKSADSPGALLNSLSQAWVKTGADMTALNAQDMQARERATGALASFLSGTKAQEQRAIEEFQIKRDLSAQRERMMGTSELMAGITGGLGQGIQTWGDISGMNGTQGWADTLRGTLNLSDAQKPMGS